MNLALLQRNKQRQSLKKMLKMKNVITNHISFKILKRRKTKLEKILIVDEKKNRTELIAHIAFFFLSTKINDESFFFLFLKKYLYLTVNNILKTLMSIQEENLNLKKQ